ncbi:MAG: hypothetical protein R2755_28585 [Acidimicrobiales bacterium]
MSRFPESDRRGAITLSCFAVVWAAAGASALPDPFGWIVLADAVAVAGIIGLRAQRAPRTSSGPPPAAMRRFAVVNVAQAAAIALAVGVLGALGAGAAIPGVVAGVVALHFVPLAEAFGQPLYRRLAAGLGVVATAGLVLAALADAWALGAVGCGAAALLLAAAYQLADSPYRALTPHPR